MNQLSMTFTHVWISQVSVQRSLCPVCQHSWAQCMDDKGIELHVDTCHATTINYVCTTYLSVVFFPSFCSLLFTCTSRSTLKDMAYARLSTWVNMRGNVWIAFAKQVCTSTLQCRLEEVAATSMRTADGLTTEVLCWLTQSVREALFITVSPLDLGVICSACAAGGDVPSSVS